MSELPLSLSIVTGEKMTVKMLERGTVLPASKTRIFTTREPIPNAIMIELVTGERLIASANRRITRLRLGGIKKTVGGVARIAVKIEVNEALEIMIEAFDYGSHHKSRQTIPSEWVPSAEETEKALSDAKGAEEEEYLIRERCLLIDRAKAAVRTVRSLTPQEREKVEPAALAELEEKTEDLKKRLKHADAMTIPEIEAKVIKEEMNAVLKTLHTID